MKHKNEDFWCFIEFYKISMSSIFLDTFILLSHLTWMIDQAFFFIMLMISAAKRKPWVITNSELVRMRNNEAFLGRFFS